MLHERTGANFQTTRWTLVGELRAGNDEARRRAMEEVSKIYWPPVYAAFRRRGCGREEAGELTQAFFVEVVLGRHLFERADASGGSLRSLIRAAAANFHIDQVRRHQRNRWAITLSADRLHREEQIAATTDARDGADAFDRRWAMVVLEEAIRRCEQYCVAHGMERNWKAYEARHVFPANACVTPRNLDDLAVEHGWDSPQDVSAAVQTVKRRFKLILQEVATEFSMCENNDGVELEAVLAALA